MTSAMIVEPMTHQVSRPRPGPGYPIAPPAPEGRAPWAAVLDHPGVAVGWKWEMNEDGALLPVPLSEDAAALTKRDALTHRLAALLRR